MAMFASKNLNWLKPRVLSILLLIFAGLLSFAGETFAFLNDTIFGIDPIGQFRITWFALIAVLLAVGVMADAYK